MRMRLRPDGTGTNLRSKLLLRELFWRENCEFGSDWGCSRLQTFVNDCGWAFALALFKLNENQNYAGTY